LITTGSKSDVLNLTLVKKKIKNDHGQGGLKLQAWTLAVLPHSLVGHSMTYGVPKILK
jgi:hypothetical protein